MWKSEKKQITIIRASGSGGIISRSSTSSSPGHLPRHSFISFRFIFYVAHDCVALLLLLLLLAPSTIHNRAELLYFCTVSVSSRGPPPLPILPVYVPMPLFTYATSKSKPDALRHVLIIRLQPSSGTADSVGSLFSISTKNERPRSPPPLSPSSCNARGSPFCLGLSDRQPFGEQLLSYAHTAGNPLTALHSSLWGSVQVGGVVGLQLWAGL